jgi:cell division protein FtsB
MAQFKNKKKYSFWHSPLVLLVLFCILVIFAYNMVGLIKKEDETSKNKLSEMQKIDDLKRRQASLEHDIGKLNTDAGIEESVRDKFQVVKPGEKMVVIVDPNEKEAPPDEPIDHSFWGFLKRLFSN